MPPSAWPCTRTGCAESRARSSSALLSSPVNWQAHPASSTQIRVGDVLLHHALRVEERAVDGDGVLHDFQEFSAIVVVHGKNHTFELVIKRFGFSRVVGRRVAGSAATRLADAPAGDTLDVAFHPPAIENAQARHTI